MAEQPFGEPPDQVADATRRTRLASERTYLAWLRTGLTAFGVGIAVGRVVPALIDVPEWPYAAVGIAFVLLGVAVVLFGMRRQMEVRRALDRGEYHEPGDVPVVALAAAASALGFATVALLIIWG